MQRLLIVVFTLSLAACSSPPGKPDGNSPGGSSAGVEGSGAKSAIESSTAIPGTTSDPGALSPSNYDESEWSVVQIVGDISVTEEADQLSIKVSCLVPPDWDLRLRLVENDQPGMLEFQAVGKGDGESGRAPKTVELQVGRPDPFSLVILNGVSGSGQPFVRIAAPEPSRPSNASDGEPDSSEESEEVPES